MRESFLGGAAKYSKRKSAHRNQAAGKGSGVGEGRIGKADVSHTARSESPEVGRDGAPKPRPYTLPWTQGR
jgi:hypothetical protein